VPVQKSPAPAPLDLSEVTVAELQSRMAAGALSAHALAAWYLDRIARIDRDGPRLNAVIELNPEALADADRLDAERASGKLRGPLHGVPVLIKDNIDSADRMRTSAGSLALAEHIAATDATVVSKLRIAGAVILGKTNMSEWANFRSTHSTSGWSGRGGQTRNPYALDRNPCGSSSGTAAAIAANLAVLGIGTETDGSITCPASANGLVGIKPTLGLISRAGIIPIAHSQDTAGPMARSVTDAALLLAAIAGSDARDPATQGADRRQSDDYQAELKPDGLRGVRLGVARKFFGFNAGVDALMERAIATLKAAGAIIVDPADLPTHGKFDEAEQAVLLYEFKPDLNAYLAQIEPALPHSLEQLIDFNKREAKREMPWFGQELFEQAQAKGPLSDKAYRDALANSKRMAGADGIDRVMAQQHLDALIAPTGGPAWLTDPINGDHFGGGATSPAAVAGYPHITVPAGLVHGLPVGLSFFGRAWSEPLLIRIAYGYEQASRARQPPRLPQTLGLD
jgi:amidase